MQIMCRLLIRGMITSVLHSVCKIDNPVHFSWKENTLQIIEKEHLRNLKYFKQLLKQSNSTRFFNSLESTKLLFNNTYHSLEVNSITITHHLLLSLLLPADHFNSLLLCYQQSSLTTIYTSNSLTYFFYSSLLVYKLICVIVSTL